MLFLMVASSLELADFTNMLTVVLTVKIIQLILLLSIQ